MNLKHSLLAAALVAIAAPLAAQAESNAVSSGSATARVDFQITVPPLLLLRVGSDASTINLIDFNVTAAQLQAGGPVAATAASGDVGNGTVTARVLGNNGQVSLRADSNGALNNGNGDTISYAQIATASSNAAVLPAPALADGVGTAVNVPLTSGTKITNATAQWTYSYSNSALVPSGTYGGVDIRNGRVTYTASMP